MTPDELVTLQLAYGGAVFEAERWRAAAEALKQRIERAAQMAAESDNSLELTPAPPQSLTAPLTHLGTFARVAKRLGVARSSVTRVARGEINSERIAQAIREEMDRNQQERDV